MCANSSSCKEAVVMAGGLGTRLGMLTAECPKPMLDVGGKPFLSYLLDYLFFNGISHVVLAVSYKHEIISTYFGKNYRGIEIDYSVSDPPMGTGGYLVTALEMACYDEVAVLNGDTLFDVNMRDLFDFHRDVSGMVTLALRTMFNTDRYGLVEIDVASKRIVGFREKAHFDKGLINGGVYVVSRSALLSVAPHVSFSFEHDFLEKYYGLYPFYGFVHDGFFIDIGTPEDYQKAQTLVPKVAEKWA